MIGEPPWREWRDREVCAYAAWLQGVTQATLIPVDRQIGKLLHECGGDIDKARDFVLKQIHRDASLTIDDEYWSKVKYRLDELIVNEIMMSE